MLREGVRGTESRDPCASAIFSLDPNTKLRNLFTCLYERMGSMTHRCGRSGTLHTCTIFYRVNDERNVQGVVI